MFGLVTLSSLGKIEWELPIFGETVKFLFANWNIPHWVVSLYTVRLEDKYVTKDGSLDLNH